MNRIYFRLIRILLVLTVVLFFLILIFFSPFLIKLVKRQFYSVDNVFAMQVINDLQKIRGFFGEGIIDSERIDHPIGWKSAYSQIVSWNDKLVRLDEDDASIIQGSSITANTIYSIKVSEDKGQTWKILYSFDQNTSGCSIGFIYGLPQNMYCITYGNNLLLIDEKGTAVKKIIKNANIFGTILGAYFKETNKLILIWRDGRLQYPALDITSPYHGPYLIMAGELNLDTLEFKEHVIGYDKYDLQELFSKDFLEDKK